VLQAPVTGLARESRRHGRGHRRPLRPRRCPSTAAWCSRSASSCALPAELPRRTAPTATASCRSFAGL